MTQQITNSTKKNYEQNLQKLDSLNINYKNTNNTQELIKNIYNIKSKSNKNNIQKSTAKNYITAIIYFHKNNKQSNETLITELRKELSKINKNIQTQVESRELIGTQIINYVQWETVLEKYKKIQQDTKEYIVASLYVLLPPRRLTDYSLMYITNNNHNLDKIINYYYDNGTKSYFIFNQYKTKKKYGTQIIYVPTKLRNIINTYLQKNNIKNMQAMLQMNETQIRYKINNAFGKNVSVDILRHSYITYLAQNGAFDKLQNRLDVARIMAHSIETQENYRKDKNNIDSDKFITFRE